MPKVIADIYGHLFTEGPARSWLDDPNIRLTRPEVDRMIEPSEEDFLHRRSRKIAAVLAGIMQASTTHFGVIVGSRSRAFLPWGLSIGAAQ